MTTTEEETTTTTTTTEPTTTLSPEQLEIELLDQLGVENPGYYEISLLGTDNFKCSRLIEFS